MKKIKLLLTGIAVSFIMTMNIMADVEFKFTSNSKFEIGESVTVDIDKMKDMDSAIYNAWLENDVEYKWYLNGTIINGANEKTLKITEDYLGKEIHVKIVCLDYEFEGGPYEVTGEMKNPPVGVETPDEVQDDEIIEPETSITTPSDEEFEKTDDNKCKIRTVEYIIFALVIVIAFIAGYFIGKTKNKIKE